MPEHPFTFDYIGLGLLDEESIARHHDSWAAEYRDAAGDPYLVVYVGPSRVRIEEYGHGRRVASTVGPKLTEAIGSHGGDALEGERSRFWERVSARAPGARVQLNCRDARFSFVPAIGIGQLCLPLPEDVPWRPPAPGRTARRIGLRPFEDAVEVRPATLARLVEGSWTLNREPIRLVKVSLSGILVPEAIDALLAAYGPTRSDEWRPFVRTNLVGRVAQIWRRPEGASAAGESGMAAFSIVEGSPTWVDADKRA